MALKISSAIAISKLRTALQITDNADWPKKLTRNKLRTIPRGRAVLAEHGGSLARLVNEGLRNETGLTSLTFYEWQFGGISHGFWKSYDNQLQFFEWYMQTKKMEALDGWYKVAQEAFRRKDKGGRILDEYGGSLPAFVKAMRPDHIWHDWKFLAVPNGYWSNRQARLAYFDWVSQEKGLTSLHDWYSVSVTELKERLCAGRLFDNYGSFCEFVMDMRPDHPWQEWKFSSAPRNFWQSPANVARFMEWASVELGIVKLEDWYAIRPARVLDLAGNNALFDPYNDWEGFLKSVFPNHTWDPFKFRFGQSPTLESMLLQVKKALDIDSPDDWYKKFDWNKLAAQAGDGYAQQIASRYKGIKSAMLNDTFGHTGHKWLEWQFRKVPAGFWSVREHQIAHFEWLMRKMELHSLEGWYGVVHRDLIRNKDKGMNASWLRNYKSIADYVKDMRPDHKWQDWRFVMKVRQVPNKK